MKNLAELRWFPVTQLKRWARRFCEKRDSYRLDYLWIRIWLLLPVRIISLTILACSGTGSTLEILSFLFLLICIPFAWVMWLGGFHCSELCSFKMRKVFVLFSLSPFLCTQGIFSYFVSQGVSPMSLLTCLSKSVFLWGQSRGPGVISRENLKVSWQLPCSPITYSLTIKFCRKVAAVEEKIVQIEWDYYGIWKHPTISIIWQHNSNTMLHSWKKDLCGAHLLGPELLAIQVHVWGWE